MELTAERTERCPARTAFAAWPEGAPERVLWGTDWPHPNVPNDMPDDGELVDLFARIVDDEALRQRILVDNPTRLYWGN